MYLLFSAGFRKYATTKPIESIPGSQPCEVITKIFDNNRVLILVTLNFRSFFHNNFGCSASASHTPMIMTATHTKLISQSLLVITLI